MKCGGLPKAEPANEEIQKICVLIHDAVMNKVGREVPFDVFTPISATTQIVAGINYFIKIHVGDENYIHIRVYKPLGDASVHELHSVVEQKQKEDAIEYF